MTPHDEIANLKITLQTDNRIFIENAEEGAVTIPFDAFYECRIMFAKADGGWLFETPLCLVGEAARGGLFEAALRLNLHGVATRGAAVALEDAVLTLRFTRRFDDIGDAGLAGVAAQFIDVARDVRGRLADTTPPVEAHERDVSRHDMIFYA